MEEKVRTIKVGNVYAQLVYSQESDTLKDVIEKYIGNILPLPSSLQDDKIRL